MNLDESVFFLRHDDDEFYDRITVEVVPRYKTSSLSGDEWRISVRVQLWRKAAVVAERSWSKLEYALAGLHGWLQTLSDGGVPDGFDRSADQQKCHQPGCAEAGAVEVRLKGRYCQVNPHAGPHPPTFDYRRRFCARHARRGDCAFEDADANYERLKGPLAAPYTTDESPSIRVDVPLSSLDDLPQAIQDARARREAGDHA